MSVHLLVWSLSFPTCASSATINVHNYSIQEDGEIVGRPIVDGNGFPLAPHSAYIAIGGYATISDAEIAEAGGSYDFSRILAPFIQLGEAGSIGQVAGLFDFDVTFALADADPLIGKAVYVAIGNDKSAGASTAWMVIRTQHVFASSEDALDLEVDLAAIERAEVILGCFIADLPMLQPNHNQTFPTGLSLPHLGGCSGTLTPFSDIYDTGIKFSDSTLSVGSEPDGFGDRGSIVLRKNADGSLTPETISNDIRHRWYLVPPDTAINSSFVQTASPLADSLTGEIQGSIPVGESFLAVWMGGLKDEEPSSSDRFGWARISVTESTVQLKASGVSKHPSGIIAGSFLVPNGSNDTHPKDLSISVFTVFSNRIRLEWKSQPGEIYAVEQSRNLVHFETSIARIESVDTRTEASFDRGIESVSYFRVRQVK